jgi:type VI secretion system protein ImpK
MSLAGPVHGFLLACFADFYEEVARIKLAIEKRTLVQLLQPAAPHAQIEADDLAERVSKRLFSLLDRQKREVAVDATDAEMAAYMRTRYVMVALADEIFILNTPWPSADYWPEHLLEYAEARTRIAGGKFFVYVEELMGCRDSTPLDSDFAAVLLLALQLGFQGKYRGDRGTALNDCRNRLYPIASGRKLRSVRSRMFPQAYEYTVVSTRDNTRLALAPWLRASVFGVLGYLAISSVVWLVLTWSLLDAIHGVASTR